MNFENDFPQLIEAATNLHGLFTKFAIPLLVLSFPLLFWRKPSDPVEIVRHLVLVFLVILLIVKSQSLINGGQELVRRMVEENIPARPENVALRYRELFEKIENLPADADTSFVGLLYSGNVFESLLYAILLLISWMAVAIQFFVFLVQKTALLLCWSFSPLLFPLFLLRPLASIASSHLLRIVGIILWPVGLALAATVTDGLLGLAVKKEMLGLTGATGSVSTGLLNLFAVALIGVWIWFSSFAAPFLVQRFVTSGGLAASFIQGFGDRLGTVASSWLRSSSSQRSRMNPAQRAETEDRPVQLAPSAAALAKVPEDQLQQTTPPGANKADEFDEPGK